MVDRDPLVAPSLAAANRRLLTLRAAHRAAHGAAHGAGSPASAPAAILGAALRRLPPHLGWSSAPASQSLRAGRPPLASPPFHQLPSQPANQPPSPPANQPTSQLAPQPPNAPPTIRHHPALGLAMLRRGLAAPGRLWLLLRHLDQDGRGWLRIASAKQQLTCSPQGPASHLPAPLCSPRQLRNLLRAGEGTFWTRDRERIWLRSALKVCASLEVERLSGRPVELPLAALLDGMGTFRAHLYAAFHSGRMPARGGEKPIARATLTRLTGASRRAQRAYEQRTGMAVQSNFALGGRADPESEKEAAWRRGRAMFTVKDVRGIQGRKGRLYLAWQLPNSYEGPHGQGARCRQRHLNRRLADLRTSRDAGNDQSHGDENAPVTHPTDPPPSRRYHRQAAAASRAARRCPPDAVYWRGQARRGGGRWWYSLPAEESL